MKARHILFTALTMICISGIQAKPFIVTATNTAKAKYHGQTCRKDMVIDRPDEIVWDSPDDAIRIRDEKTGRKTTLRPKQYVDPESGKIALKSDIQLAHRGMGEDDELDLNELIDALKEIVVFDEWRVYTAFDNDDECYYIIRFADGDEVRECRLPSDRDKALVIPASVFDGIEGDEIKAQIEYHIEDQVIPLSYESTIILTRSVEVPED